MNDAFKGDQVRLAFSTAVADALTQTTVVDALVDAVKDHQGYKQHLNTCMAPVAERIAAEYAANVQSATISVLRNESVAGDQGTRAPPDGPATAAGTTTHTRMATRIEIPLPSGRRNHRGKARRPRPQAHSAVQVVSHRA